MQRAGGPIFTIYTSYDVFLCKELHFGVAMIASALKNVTLNFLMAINSLKRKRVN